MANPKHVEVVRQGAAAIAEWRRQNPGALLHLNKGNLAWTYLSGADLSGADLLEANLTGATLRGADLTGANLLRADLTGANLCGANLAQANLRTAGLFATTLRGAILAGAVLAGADLREANLIRADLSGADLFWANLDDADLTGASLMGTSLRGASLRGADLSGADLAGARLGSTSLGRCDLSQATGLSSVDHVAPSSVGVDTLIATFRGAGNRLTPELETFFLSAGVPRELLAELPRIVGAVEFYSCFISYGQPDEDFAKKLRDDLTARGVPCWLYDLDATPGERTWKEIRKKQREADKMVVICSAAALIRDGVLKEIEEQIDDDPGKMVPISRDKLWMERGFRVERGSRDLKPFLLDKNYADFSDDSRYDEALQRLLKALRRKAE